MGGGNVSAPPPVYSCLQLLLLERKHTESPRENLCKSHRCLDRLPSAILGLGNHRNENEASHEIKTTRNGKLLKVTIRVGTALVEVPNLTVHCRNRVSPLAVKRQLARRGVSGTAAPCLPAHVAHFTKIMLRLASAEMEALGNLLEQI